MYNKPSQQRYGRTCITVAKKKKTSSSVLMTKSLIRSQLADGPPDRFRRGHPVSLLGPSGADQQEAQDGCQNGQLWLGVPLWESREMLFGENAIRRPQFAKPCLMDLLCISPFIRGGPPKAPFIGELTAKGGLRG